MGIGSAFAIGLINGFTNNIQEEKAKRAADKASLDDLRMSMIEAYSDDNAELGDAIGNIIDGGEEQIKGLGRVDLFGRPSQQMDLDFTKLRDTVNSVDSTGLSFGSGPNKITFLKDIDYGGTSAEIGMLIADASGKFLDPEYQRRFNNMDQTEKNRLVDTLFGARQQYRSNVAGDKNIDIDVGQNEQTGFQGLYWLDQAAKGLNIVPEGARNIAGLTVTQAEEIEVIRNNYINNNPKAAAKGTVLVGVSGDYDKEDGNVMVLNDIQYANLATIADKFDVETDAFFYTWQTSITNDLGMSAQKSKDLLLASLQIPSEIRNVGALDPDNYKFKLEQNEKNMIAAVEKLDKLVGNDLQAMAYVLAPHMTYDMAVPESEVGFGEVKKVKNETIQNYILRKMYGDKAKDVKFSDFQEQAQAIINTSNSLSNFKALVQQRVLDGQGPEAAGSLILGFGGIFGLKDGYIKTLVDATTTSIGSALNIGKKAGYNQYDLGTIAEEGRINVYNAKQYTIEYDQALKERITLARNTYGNNAAELEALRITLAFEMARAADPSGRLSNQDIELQYKKLGSPFRNPIDALPALDIVMEEFEKKRNQVELLQKLGSSTRQGTTKDFLVIDGLITADYLLRNKEGMVARQTGKVDIMQAPNSYNLEDYEIFSGETATSKGYTNKSGNTIYQISPKSSPGEAVRIGGAPVFVDSMGNVVPPEEVVRPK